MESAREEPLSLLSAILERTAGGSWWYAHMVGNILYTILILPLAGCIDALLLVAVVDVYH